MNQRQKRNRSILFWGLGILGVFLLAASIFVIRSLSIFNDTLEDITTETVRGLLSVDKQLWLDEAKGIEEFYSKFGDKLPKELADELSSLKERLR